MKVSKKTGKVKLESDEVRVGNFFVKREDDHMKIQDLNGVFSFRASRRIAVGIWLENIWSRAMNGDEGAVNTLKTYIATMWSVFSVAPDDEYISDALEMAGSALHRHPGWYGIDESPTPEDDAEAVEEVREMKEFEAELKRIDGQAGESVVADED